MLHTHTASGLVDQVNGLIGHVAIRNIAACHLSCSLDSLIGNGQSMVRLITFADTLENINRLLDGWLTDNNLLEAPLQGSITLDVFAVLIKSGSTDTLQLTASKGRLENICRVNSPFSSTGTNERMYLVNEDNAVAAIANLLDDLLETLFKLTTILGTRY